MAVAAIMAVALTVSQAVNTSTVSRNLKRKDKPPAVEKSAEDSE